ncbi:nicotinate phosphoribosyltransferase [Candidatus Poribacteria bacterium]|nr:nicotinate phosphoribosyltransferase [Candidatus Poribacteria bacterium]
MTTPRSLLIPPEHTAIVTDLYQLTMAAAYYESGRTGLASFEMFVRRLPRDRGYLLLAGLEQALHYLETLRFEPEAIDYLRFPPTFASVSDGFFDYLAGFRFTGSVDAIAEGTLVFANEPLVTVTAPIIEAQLIETYLLTTVNYQTLVATKAARVVGAASGRAAVDFGTRRAHGPQAGVLAARAAYIGGCAGTSNVYAGHALGVPIAGTMAHSFVMAYASEDEAFEAYARAFPRHATVLVDTYDTVAGARTAARMSTRPQAVRIDSGNLERGSRDVRDILDAAGLHDVKIVASSDLNEYIIEELVAAGAPIDGFGVGTELVTSRDDPALSGVYKLVAYEHGGETVGVAKLSEDKATYPGAKQVFRAADFSGDVVGAADERLPGEPLLRRVMDGGGVCAALPSLEDVRERAAGELMRIPTGCRRLRQPDTYPVRYSNRVLELPGDAPGRDA